MRLFAPRPRRDRMRICPQPTFCGTGFCFELRQRRVFGCVWLIPPGQARLDQLLAEATAIGQQYLAHKPTVAVCGMDDDGDLLLKDEVCRELPCLGPKGLRLLRRVDAIQPDLDRLALT